jgi:uncharacterized membrane protein YfcA
VEHLILSLLLGSGIGLSLGLLGGGGSILTVPALVYLIGQSPQAAVTTSLAIVGANSAMGVLFHRTQGTVNWRVATLFGGIGMAMAYLAAGISKQFSATALLVAFALLMLLISVLMLRSRTVTPDEDCPLSLSKILVSGAVVGILTGILGVGGGFLIVPALVMLVGLPIRQAVGTSLVIIAMNSAAGLLGHIGSTLDVQITLLFIVGGLAGSFAGSRLASHLNADHLRRLFALFVLVLGALLLFDNLPKLL